MQITLRLQNQAEDSNPTRHELSPVRNTGVRFTNFREFRKAAQETLSVYPSSPGDADHVLKAIAYF